MYEQCHFCLFFIPVCINHRELIKLAEQYTKGRIQWTEKCEKLYKELSDDDGVCMVHQTIVACEQKVCRMFVSYTKAKIKLSLI